MVEVGMSITTSAQKVLQTAPERRTGELPERYWELVEGYRGELVNQAYAILKALPDAEDVVQETFCEAMLKGEKLAQARSLGAWLRSVNRGNALNRLRALGRAARKNAQKIGRASCRERVYVLV